MSEESRARKLRFIREEPWVARTLRGIRIGVAPKELHTWLWDWVEDVGRAMRSREMMVGFAASMGYYAILMALLSVVERLGVAPRLTRLLRVAARGYS